MASTEKLTATNETNTVVRLVVISDTHGYHHHLTPLLPDGDILIHLGDFCNKGSTDDALNFTEWITKQANTKYPEVYVIDGNHDRTFVRRPKYITEALNLHDVFSKATEATNGRLQFLQDDFVTTKHHGLHLFGVSWASCADGKFPQKFPPLGQPDVMLAHINLYLPETITMPHGYQHGWLGKRGLSKTVLSNQIPLCLTGHVHWSRGVVQVPHNTDTDQGRTSSTFINAATLKSRHLGIVMNKPVVIDYDLVQRKPIRIVCPVL
jgi:3',5'-cyclic AMP phosphodiesterase CpdA